MKKLLMLSAVAISVFASDYQVGAGFGRNGVSNSIQNYNFGNIRIGKTLPKNHILRLEVEKATNITTNKESDSLSRALLNVEKDFYIDYKVTPYAFIGAGYQWINGKYSNSAVADLGIGAKYNIYKSFDLFIEGRGLRDFDNEANHYGLIIGFTFNFGGEKTSVKTEPAKPLDSDNDGIIDSLDKCPNTPAGAKVNNNGCPIDSDNDGIADYLDKCLNTPANVKVDNNGCPIDSDNDGIADYLDKCPNTPAGAKVDNNGCLKTFNLNITFANNSTKINKKFLPKINELVEFLKANPNIKIEIQGYTDNRGSKAYNIMISKKRAKAVYLKLLDLGVNKNQLTWAGYGPKNPIASNTTKEGRAQNRRVVAKVLK